MPTTVGTFTFTIQITDSVGGNATSAPITITINAAGALRITSTSPLPNATVGNAYSFTFAATGGTMPYTWSVAQGSNLPANFQLSAAGVLTGTAAANGTGVFNFSITVTDSANPSASNTVPFQLTITTGAAASGSYAFQFVGKQNVMSGNVTIAEHVVGGGVFTIGANGTISGTIDFNGENNQNFIGQSFTGTIQVGADNRGTLTINGIKPANLTFAIALDAKAAHGRMIQNDSTGIHSSGELFQQGSQTSCTTSAMNGGYSFGTNGVSSPQTAAGVAIAAGPAVFIGRFSTDGAAGFSNGEADFNTPNAIQHLSPGTLTGTIANGSSQSFCRLNLTGGSVDTNFDIFPYAGNNKLVTKAFIVEIDPLNTTTFLLMSGKLFLQNPILTPFNSQTALQGTSVAGIVGNVSFDGGLTYLTDDWVAQLNGSGSSFVLSYTENRVEPNGNGLTQVINTFTPSTNPPSPTGNFSIDQFGFVSFGISTYAMYMTDVNQGFFMTTTISGINPVFGEFDPQTSSTQGITNGPFSASTIKGTLVEGSLPPTTGTSPHFSGVATLDGVSSVTGTQDSATINGITLAQTLTGSYTVNNATATSPPVTGTGTYTLTSPSNLTGVLFVVSPTKFVVLTTTANDTNPAVLIFGN
jgi:hypothetical protein